MGASIPRTLWILALVAGVLLAPLEARIQTDRGMDAAVVTDGEAYLGLTLLSPTLDAANSYQDSAVTVTHGHPTGTSLEVSVTSSDLRFEIVDGTFTLTPGGSSTASIHDTSAVHTTGTFAVEVTITSELWEDGAEIGAQSATRTITVEVQ